MEKFWSHPIVVSLLTLLGVAFILLLIQYVQCTGKNGVCRFFSIQGLKDLFLKKDDNTQFSRPCGDQFFVKLQELAPDKIRVMNVAKIEGKWQTWQLTVVPDGVEDAEALSEYKEITEAKKDELCAQIYHPQYPWYTQANQGGYSEGGH